MKAENSSLLRWFHHKKRIIKFKRRN